MTRKDYVAISDSIMFSSLFASLNENEEWKKGYKDAISFISNELAIVFEEDNSRFDRIKFLKACGVI